jgi:hypothetical protein
VSGLNKILMISADREDFARVSVSLAGGIGNNESQMIKDRDDFRK